MNCLHISLGRYPNVAFYGRAPRFVWNILVSPMGEVCNLTAWELKARVRSR